MENIFINNFSRNNFQNNFFTPAEDFTFNFLYTLPLDTGSSMFELLTDKETCKQLAPGLAGATEVFNKVLIGTQLGEYAFYQAVETAW